jgi:vesicle-fusing ATPase
LTQKVDYSFKVTDHEFIEEKTALHFGMVFEETGFEFKSKSNTLKIKSASMKEKNVFGKKFKFEDIGVGGMDKQIIEIFRRAFATRRLPPSVLEKYGGSHIKGVLLYGPPGTGKTLIAKELAKCLNSVKPKVINGPELLSKYVGESEENVRKLFAEARRDQADLGDDSPLHVLIFDEFDSIAKPRGMDSDSTGVGSNVVNQLLSMIDGVDSLNNILLIAMTNRKDLIDPAILRPGRFETHIEISLPDEHGRLQILNIHTKKMRENNILAPDVDLQKIASMTKNYTGAELESVVKSAKSFALNRKHDLMNFTKELVFNKDTMSIEMEDFMSALGEVKPDFGLDENKIDSRLRGSIISYGKAFDDLMVNLKDSIDGFAQSDMAVSRFNSSCPPFYFTDQVVQARPPWLADWPKRLRFLSPS